jgi:hypothetical protein
MPNFLARIEIHGGDDEDYKKLHSIMTTLDYTNYHLLPLGEYKKQLPPGTYIRKQGTLGVGDLAKHDELAKETDRLFNCINVSGLSKSAPSIVVTTFDLLYDRRLLTIPA